MAFAGDRKKILVFGLLGAIGCLVGWAFGEGFLAAFLPAARQERAPSLVSTVDTIAVSATSQPVAPPAPIASSDALVVSAPPPPPISTKLERPQGLFALRTAPNREQLTARLGASPQSESAVQEGFEWLARHQANRGYWSDAGKCEPGQPCEHFKYENAPIAETGLAILALQAGGNYYFNDKKYSRQVTRGLDWLVAQQGEDGRLFGQRENQGGLDGLLGALLDMGSHTWYQHGIATFALAEACAVALANQQKPNDRYLDAATRAVRFMEKHQYRQGGWQYALDSGGIGDTSVTGWQVLALKSAMEAKIPVSLDTMQRVQKFFETCGNPEEGTTGYQSSYGGTNLTTAVGLIFQEFILKQPDSRLAKNAVRLLGRETADLGTNGDFYTLYNCTLAMFLAGGDDWKKWNDGVRDAVIQRQDKKDCQRGSWDDKYGRTLGTAWALLTLQVYYRYATEQAKSMPALQLAVPPEVTIHPGVEAEINVRVTREGISGPVRVRCDGDLRGLKIKDLELPEDQEVATLHLNPEETAEIGLRTLRVLAEAGTVTAEEQFKARIEPLPPLLRVSVSPEVVLLPGASNTAFVRVVRERVSGAVRLRCEGDISGLSIREIELAEDKRDSPLEIAADSLATAGARELRLVGEAGTLKDEQKFSVQIQPIPPVLRIAAPPQVVLNPENTTIVPVRIARERFQGPVDVFLKSNVAGLSLPRLTIAADSNEGQLSLTADRTANVGNHAITLQATSGPFQTQTDFTAVLPEKPLFPWSLVVVIGTWTGLIATSLALALAVGQNWYLSRRLPRWQQVLTLVGGGMLAGVVAGGIGQALFSLLAQADVTPQLGFLIGWILLGGLVGRGIGFFIPNLHGGKAAMAGAAGGLLGAAAFLGVSTLGDFAGRCVGAAILGFCIGLVVALIEAAFRDAWLEVMYGAKEMRTVNLGPEPIRIGSNSACTIWTRVDQPVALKFWINNGRISREDVPANRTSEVAAGHREKVGTLEIVVCSGKATTTPTASAAPPPPPPPPPVRPAKPIVSKTPPQAAAPTVKPVPESKPSPAASVPPPPVKRPPPPPPRPPSRPNRTD